MSTHENKRSTLEKVSKKQKHGMGNDWSRVQFSLEGAEIYQKW